MLTEEPEGVVVGLERKKPDISVVREAAVRYSAGSSAAPLKVRAVIMPTASHYTVVVRETRYKRVVTAIEVLSPSNKRGEGAKAYQAKRMAYLQASVHLIEIDLLRAGERVPMVDELPASPYLVILHRWQAQPIADVWPINLDNRLPQIPVPLEQGDEDLLLDLQPVLNEVYDNLRMNEMIDYRDEPAGRFTDEEKTWIDDVLSPIRRAASAVV